VAQLVSQGQTALAEEDPRTAKARFLSALAMILAEPSLRTQELGIVGWLDHALREAEQDRWRQRAAPRLYEARRDEAVLAVGLLDPAQASEVRAAREAIQAALELTVADDPAWRSERDKLVLLGAELSLREGKPEQALAALEQTSGASCRLWRERRAYCLDKLGRASEADSERQLAARVPPADAFECFVHGIERYHSGDLAGAIAQFDQALQLEPAHFPGRFAQGVCFLHAGRPGESKVAFTACIAQRPQFAWTPGYRAMAFLQLGDRTAADEDFRYARELFTAEAGPAGQATAAAKWNRLVREKRLLRLGD
jgi:tetratricopeptide (TPR) repeat protein